VSVHFRRHRKKVPVNGSGRIVDRVWVLAAFVAPLIPAYLAASQGINLLDDGLWLLGTRIVMSGGCLYRDLFAIYGPAKFFLLIPFFAVVGHSALALSALKAVTVAAASSMGYAALRRRVPMWAAWIIPLGALALWMTKPRYVVAGALALALAWCLQKPRGMRTWFLLGLGWTATASFGFDGAVYGVLILAGSIVFARHLRPGVRRLLALVCGAGVGLALLMVIGLFNGVLGDAVWDTVVYPLTRFGNEMGISPLESFTDGDAVGALFVDHQTGEAFVDAWPGHRAMLSLARRLLYLGLLCMPPLGAWIAWKRGDHPLLAALSAFALAGWTTAAVRGEASHLAAGWLGTLWLLPLLVEELGPRGRALRRIGLAGFVVVALVPLAYEPIWLATHAHRPGLAVWERESAGIRLTQERVDKLEALGDRFENGLYGAAVFWPARPGLNFFYDSPLASSQATLLGGEVRDPQRILAELGAKPGHTVFIQPPLRRDRNSNKEVAPVVWDGLRRKYHVSDLLTGGPDEFSVLTPLTPGVSIEKVPLRVRLYDEKFGIADALSPTLGPQSFVGQGLPVGPRPLSGMAVRMAVAKDTEAPLWIRVRTLENDQPGVELGSYRLDLKLIAGQRLYYLPFGPVPGSASRNVLVEFGLQRPATSEIALLWHLDGGIYNGGHAWVNGRPTQSTLYFKSF
jgi:hypothetical protein